MLILGSIVIDLCNIKFKNYYIILLILNLKK